MTDKAKKTKWSYNEAMATVLFPDGATQDFDTNLIHADCEQFLYHYGVKQFLSDKIAGIGKGATSAMKLAVFDEYFELLCEGKTAKAGGAKGGYKTKAEMIATFMEKGMSQEDAEEMYEALRK